MAEGGAADSTFFPAHHGQRKSKTTNTAQFTAEAIQDQRMI
jgi:hypothetical protein